MVRCILQNLLVGNILRNNGKIAIVSGVRLLRVWVAILFRLFDCFYCPQNVKLFDFPIFRFSAYLMKVIPETRRAHSIWYLRFHQRNSSLSVVLLFWYLQCRTNVVALIISSLPEFCILVFYMKSFKIPKKVIRIRKSKKDIQHNGLKKKGQRDKQRSRKH